MTRGEQRVVDVVRERLGAVPVVLCGSRAAGTATAASDYDVLVGLPRRRIPSAVRTLPALSRALTAELGAPVSLNPMPMHLLSKSQPNLLTWKIRREGRFLASLAPPLPALPAHPPAPPARFSYLVSAVEYLLEDLDDNLRPQTSRGSRKALLHLAQIRLLETGRYASTLVEALQALCDDNLTAIYEGIDEPSAWFTLRDALIGELAGSSQARSWRRAARVNVRYVVLSALRGESRLRAGCSRRAIDERLGGALLALTRAIREGAAPDPVAIELAASAIPASIRPRSGTWPTYHELVRGEWPAAHPLLAQ